MIETKQTSLVEAFCAKCRNVIIEEIEGIVREHGWHGSELDTAVLTYPLRVAKGLRPSLCLSVTRALGGCEEAVLRSAAVIELFHNAFLVHDDVEDESLLRRGEPTLQKAFGVPIAINTGDAMFSLGFSALLANTELLGLRVSLEIFELIAEMLRVTVGGQAKELSWIRDNRWQFTSTSYRAEYEDLVIRKTATYSFIVPVSLGAIAANADANTRRYLADFARSVGIAFQITDDLLNLRADLSAYGKESEGDLWEGKRTLILLHALHEESARTSCTRAQQILARRRPGFWPDQENGYKSPEDIHYLADLVRRHRSEVYAQAVAAEHVAAAQHALEACSSSLAPGEAREFMMALPRYASQRLL